jgi:hypothetical protein
MKIHYGTLVVGVVLGAVAFMLYQKYKKPATI